MIVYEDIKKQILDYNKKRNWINQAPGDVAKSIIIEAAELLEHFQWDETSTKNPTDLKNKDWKEVGTEVADIFWYLITFCDLTNMDLLEITKNKINYNEIKYPLDEKGLTLGNNYYMKRKLQFRKNKSTKKI